MAEVLRVMLRLFCSPRELSVCSSRFSSCHYLKLSSFPLLSCSFPPSPYLSLFPRLSFFLVPTLPCVLSRDNYHYLSSLQGSVCSAEMRSVKGRWESIRSEGKVINTHTHTHTHTHTAVPRRFVTPDHDKPITKQCEVNQKQRLCNLRELVNCNNNDEIQTISAATAKGAHWWSCTYWVILQFIKCNVLIISQIRSGTLVTLLWF